MQSSPELLSEMLLLVVTIHTGNITIQEKSIYCHFLLLFITVSHHACLQSTDPSLTRREASGSAWLLCGTELLLGHESR